MSNFKNNQMGFSAIEGLLALVIVAVISGVGFFVYHSSQVADKTLVPVTTSTPALKKSPKVAPTTTTTPVSTNSQQYLDIKELGIKLPVPSAAIDLTYTWTGSEAKLSSATLNTYAEQTDPSCSGTTAAVNIGSIDTLSSAPQVNSPTEVTLQDKYYYLFSAQSGCDPSQPGGTALNNKSVAVYEAVVAAFKQATVD